MRTGFLKKMVVGAIAIVIFGFTPAWSAQDKPADNMQILRDKIRADKKLVVATNMELTESEAKGFWPVYDAYQKDLQAQSTPRQSAGELRDRSRWQIAHRRQGQEAGR